MRSSSISKASSPQVGDEDTAQINRQGRALLRTHIFQLQEQCSCPPLSCLRYPASTLLPAWQASMTIHLIDRSRILCAAFYKGWHVTLVKCPFSVALVVKNLPSNAGEAQVRSLGWKDPLEKEMAIQSSILAWRISMDRGTWWAIVHGVPKRWTWLKWLSTSTKKMLFVFCYFWHNGRCTFMLYNAIIPPFKNFYFPPP